jgi:hypothetical protein
MTDTAVPSNEDILKFCVSLLTARDDHDLITEVIDGELAGLHEYLHSTYLMVTLRTVINQFFAPAANMLNDTYGPGYVDTILGAQGAANEGFTLGPQDAGHG